MNEIQDKIDNLQDRVVLLENEWKREVQRDKLPIHLLLLMSYGSLLYKDILADIIQWFQKLF